MKELATEKTMTIKEVAATLGTAESTIRNKAALLFPDAVQNGKTTYLTESQVTDIKEDLVPRTLTLKSKVENAVTDIEMSEMTFKVLAYHLEKSKRLEDENSALIIERQIMLPKVESAEALTRCDKNMSITETAKHFGLHPKTQVFPYLRARGYLTSRDLPTQEAISRGIMTVRQNPVGNGDFYSQAVVEKSALELWRTSIIPAIHNWIEEVHA